jgi:branched-chain amino acid aminotransferase
MAQYAYFRKQFVPLSEAKLSVLTHAFHYGTACFEGIRCNWNEERQSFYLFRGPEHFQRLLQSCRILKINLPYSVEELCEMAARLVKMNGYQEDIYLRPVAYKSQEVVANLKLHELQDDFLMLVVPFGAYLDASKGIRCCTSSWRRVDDTMVPPRAKINGLYVNSVLAKTEAVLNGFDEAIMLNTNGYVAEGTGENLFFVSKSKLITPAPADDILMGITRDTVIHLAKEELGIETVERSVGRTELYLADECFLTGTAAHLSPVVELDHRKIGDGKIGPITQKLSNLYFDVIRGRDEKYLHWCMPIPAKVKA